MNTKTVAVAIPTRNRPEKLCHCLTALKKAQQQFNFLVYVCDSSDAEKTRAHVRHVCQKFEFVRYYSHNGKNVAAARNFCARVTDAELIINVDDDIYVEPDAIKLLVQAYQKGEGARVVAGSVAWNNDWSAPIVMRLIGYGRKVVPGETPSFIVGAFFIYPRAFALTWPWNERIRTSDDRFMGALWCSKGVKLLYEPRARAFHDDEHVKYDVKEQESHIYANLFEALIASPNIIRFLSYEFLGFAAGAKLYFRKTHTAIAYIQAWIRGHQALWRDWQYLKQYQHRPIPDFKKREIAPTAEILVLAQTD